MVDNAMESLAGAKNNKFMFFFWHIVIVFTPNMKSEHEWLEEGRDCMLLVGFHHPLFGQLHV